MCFNITAVSGSPESDPKTNPMTVDYSKLTPVLTKAIQELKVIVENQQKLIEELESRLN
ncbi:MAG: hypothetical protein GY936_00915 [Ignavibacteriae bacterium]|nr:hypothetical protein [Ignavibacteriota bacterium]